MELSKFKSLELPVVQQSFIDHYDGTIESIVRFTDLKVILNPSFNYHYFIYEIHPNGTITTTRDTTGVEAPWGTQSEEAERNAYELANEVRRYLLSFPLKRADDLYTLSELRTMGAKVDRVRKRAYINVGGEWVHINGLNLNSRSAEEKSSMTYFVEVDAGFDWLAGFLNWNGKVVPDFANAQIFDCKEDAVEAAASFNAEYGRNGKIYARAR